MLTGTPLDLTPFGEIFRWIGNSLVIGWLVATLWLLISRVGKRASKRDKLVSAGKVLGVMVGIPAALIGWQAYTVGRERAEFRARYEVAEALFKKRCETAGEFIYKAVPDVKGIVWMKWRPKEVNHGDQFKMDDPYGHDCYGEGCIKELLVATEGTDLKYDGEYLFPYGKGYEFVEAQDPADNKFYRYRLRLYHPRARDSTWPASEVRSELFKEPIAGFTADYGLTWDDISTREDRDSWIAGGRLSVVNRKTSESIATRVGYMMDRGLGSTAGFRSPWAFAGDYACPERVDEMGKRTEVGFTRRFAFKVIEPVKGAKQ
ncbi:MAG: hypothetical protein IV094_04700 [Vitreoscilla sp.]|nr:hypothetical protein [Vitreoscilla sp.]